LPASASPPAVGRRKGRRIRRQLGGAAHLAASVSENPGISWEFAEEMVISREFNRKKCDLMTNDPKNDQKWGFNGDMMVFFKHK